MTRNYQFGDGDLRDGDVAGDDSAIGADRA
jgi:hypothetical protein